jgi:type IV pilus assembly protein PilB
MLQDEDIRLAKALLNQGYLDKVRYEKFIRLMKETQTEGAASVLVEELDVNDDVVADVLSREFQIPFVQLTPELVTAPSKLFPDIVLQKHRIIPILSSGVELTVGFVDPPAKQVIDVLRQDVKMFVVPVAITLSAYNSIARADPSGFDEIKLIPAKINLDILDIQKAGRDRYQELQRAGKIPGAEPLFEEILLRGIKNNATDIHIEPTDTALRVRLNNDGVIEHLVSLSKEFYENLLNIIKARAGINSFEKKKPQDGRFSSTFGKRTFDFRVSMVPTLDGERVAIRILKKSARLLNIHDLGLSPENLSKVQYLLRRPRGMFLVVGPSGSGKTSTLYAGINELRASQKVVMTVENPVEYRLEFAGQVQVDVDAKLDFANALRAILRQNPDVIMLGEIRDAETGIAAAEAALTGNLVISTMLSSDALSSIPRLASLGVTAGWLAPTLNGVVYQQLVRKVCRYCKEEYTPSHRILTSAGLEQLVGSLILYRGKGCEKCGGDGYLGRTALHEVLIIDDDMRDLIFQQASLTKLKEAARARGFESIRFDAAKKLVSGLISVEEYFRVLG